MTTEVAGTRFNSDNVLTRITYIIYTIIVIFYDDKPPRALLTASFFRLIVGTCHIHIHTHTTTHWHWLTTHIIIIISCILFIPFNINVYMFDERDLCAQIKFGSVHFCEIGNCQVQIMRFVVVVVVHNHIVFHNISFVTFKMTRITLWVWLINNVVASFILYI